MPPDPPASQLPALHGLADKLKTTGVTQYALAQWLGVGPGAVRRWVREGMQTGRHIELLHDWIAGRIVAKRVASRHWEFVPAEDLMTPDEKRAHQLLLAVRSGLAVVRSTPTGVEIVLRSAEESLTQGIPGSEDAAMEKVQREKRPGHKSQRTTVALYEDDRALVEAEARRRGITVGHFIRLAIREAGVKLNLAG